MPHWFINAQESAEEGQNGNIVDEIKNETLFRGIKKYNIERLQCQILIEDLIND